MEISKQKFMDALSLMIFVLFMNICNGFTQKCSGSLNGHLLIADTHAIYKVDPNGERKEVVVKTTDTYSLDYDCSINILYYNNMKERQIFALKENSSKPVLAVPKQNNWLPFGIAIESVSSKLYATDVFSGSIRIFDLKNVNNQGIRRNNLTAVKDIELDPYEGYLFILDEYQILRTDLDGANLNSIYSELIKIDDLFDQIPDILNPLFSSFNIDHGNSEKFEKKIPISDLVLDINKKRLFWVNTETRSIESSNYNGEDRRTYFVEKSVTESTSYSLASLAYLDDFIYWADDVTKQVIKVDINNRNKSQVILKNIEPRAIKAVNSLIYRQINNPCTNNGQCQQLCLLSKSRKTNFKCDCNIGYELAKDGKSCIKIEDFLILTQNNDIRGLSLTFNNEAPVDVINPSTFPTGSKSILSVNVKDGIIYHNGLFPYDKIYQAQLNDGIQITLQPDLLSHNVGALTFDWASRNLYYFTYYYADVTTLSVLNVDNPTYSKILIDSVRRLVRSVTVHPNKCYIYFSQWFENQGRINRLFTDGSDLKVLINTKQDVGMESLTIDYVEDRLYWIESNEAKNIFYIKHSDLDGKDIQEFQILNELTTPSTLTVHGDSIYALGNSDQSLYRLNKQSRKSVALIHTKTVDSLRGLQIFSSSAQKVRPDHPCINNKCQKFCFAIPERNQGLKRICACPYGEKLAADGKSCEDNSKVEPPFKPCNFSFRCNMSKVNI